MNSRERLLRTINGEVTDRVPVTLFIQDHGHFIHQLHPEIDPLDYEQLTFRVIDYQKSLGCDVFARMIFDLYHPLGICLGGVDDGILGTWVSGGPFTIQSADFLEYGTPLENVEEFVATAQQHAAY